MNRKIKIKVIMIAVISVILCTLTKSYAASYSVNINKSQLEVGQSTTLTINANEVYGKVIISADSKVTLDKNEIFLEGKPQSINVTAEEIGTCTIKVTPQNLYDNDEQPVPAEPKNIPLTIKAKATQSETSDNNNNNSNNSSSNNNNSTDTEEKEEKSSNANLASLTIGSGTLTPKFNKSTTTYAVTLEDDVTSLTVNAKAEDSKAKVEISGNTNLKQGKNPITILVTAEDGTTKTYTINAIKDGTQEEEEEEEETTSSYVKLGLESLSIEGVTLDPKFDPSTYTYNVTIKDDSITSLNVNAIATDENATVEIVGNENLQPGENIITIIITSKNGEDIRVYQIFVTKTTEEVAEVSEENSNMQMWYIIGGSVVGVLILLIIILIIVKKKKSKKSTENKSNKKEESVEIEIENKPVEKKKKTNKKSDKGKH